MPSFGFAADNQLITRLEVKCVIAWGSRSIDVTGVFDTGATKSCISERVIRAINPHYIGQITCDTISQENVRGVKYNVNVTVGNINLGKLIVNHIPSFNWSNVHFQILNLYG